jgi:hypothetical protein
MSNDESSSMSNDESSSAEEGKTKRTSISLVG